MGKQAKERARRHRLNLRVRANEVNDFTGLGNIWDTPTTKEKPHGEGKYSSARGGSGIPGGTTTRT